MKDIKDISITYPLKELGKLFYRYNLVIFIVLVTGGLIYSIIILNNIITQPNDDSLPNTGSSSSLSPNISSFDQSTINRLQKLETSANNTNYQTLPSGRINPFSE